MRQIEKTITANTSFDEAVAELKAFAKSQLAGILAPKMLLVLRKQD